MNYNLTRETRQQRRKFGLAQIRQRDEATMKIVVGSLLGAIASVGIYLIELKHGDCLSEIIWNTFERLL